jgi:hypothetical protein
MSDYSTSNLSTEPNNSPDTISAGVLLEIKRAEYEKAKIAYDLAEKKSNDKEKN